MTQTETCSFEMQSPITFLLEVEGEEEWIHQVEEEEYHCHRLQGQDEVEGKAYMETTSHCHCLIRRIPVEMKQCK